VAATTPALAATGSSGADIRPCRPSRCLVGDGRVAGVALALLMLVSLQGPWLQWPLEGAKQRALGQHLGS